MTLIDGRQREQRKKLTTHRNCDSVRMLLPLMLSLQRMRGVWAAVGLMIGGGSPVAWPRATERKKPLTAGATWRLAAAMSECA